MKGLGLVCNSETDVPLLWNASLSSGIEKCIFYNIMQVKSTCSLLVIVKTVKREWNFYCDGW
jgi:hypothetical protein